MKRPLLVLSIVLILVTPIIALDQNPLAVIDKFNKHFSRIRDAEADFTLDLNLFVFSCSGLHRTEGKLYYKAPGHLKAVLNDGTLYWGNYNNFRKIDPQKRYFYVYLKNAIDFAVGYSPALIRHNFNLKVIKNASDEVVIEGLPKPGILKNARKVIFHFNPQSSLLEKFDVIFDNKALSGTIYVDYDKQGDLMVPTGFHGQTAFELREGLLVGFGLKLKSTNLKLNQGLSDKLFDPGF